MIKAKFFIAADELAAKHILVEFKHWIEASNSKNDMIYSHKFKVPFWHRKYLSLAIEILVV